MKYLTWGIFQMSLPHRGPLRRIAFQTRWFNNRRRDATPLTCNKSMYLVEDNLDFLINNLIGDSDEQSIFITKTPSFSIYYCWTNLRGKNAFDCVINQKCTDFQT